MTQHWLGNSNLNEASSENPVGPCLNVVWQTRFRELRDSNLFPLPAPCDGKRMDALFIYLFIYL